MKNSRIRILIFSAFVSCTVICIFTTLLFYPFLTSSRGVSVWEIFEVFLLFATISYVLAGVLAVPLYILANILIKDVGYIEPILISIAISILSAIYLNIVALVVVLPLGILCSVMTHFMYVKIVKKYQNNNIDRL